MSIEIRDGGPAFPVAIMARQADGQPITGYDFGVQGMSLRDWFAGKALQGMLASGDVDLARGKKLGEILAPAAFALADAMVTAREGDPQP